MREDPIADLCILDRILLHLLNYPRRRGEDDIALIARWRREAATAHELLRYLGDEADLLTMAANRLNVSGDEELREMGHELALSGRRLRVLGGIDTERNHHPR